MSHTDHIEEIHSAILNNIDVARSHVTRLSKDQLEYAIYSALEKHIPKLITTSFEKGKDEGKEQLLRTLLNSLPLRSDWDDDEKVTFQMAVNAMREVLESYLPNGE